MKAWGRRKTSVRAVLLLGMVYKYALKRSQTCIADRLHVRIGQALESLDSVADEPAELVRRIYEPMMTIFNVRTANGANLERAVLQ